MRIMPYLPDGMNEFTCQYRSVKGNIVVHVKDGGEAILLDLNIPEGVQYTVDVSNLERSKKKVLVSG